MIKGVKSIAEYAIRKWLQDENFVMGCFELTVDGNYGTLKDRDGNTLELVYDNKYKTVYVEV